MATRPDFPDDEFAASDDPEHRAAVDAFRREYGAELPDGGRLSEHAERMRAVPSFVAPFERWWMTPRVQAFIAELGGTGV